jgi:nicotinamide-nucleotide amidase
VGTVHIATARTNQRIVHEEHFFEFETREEIQLAAVQAALQMLRDRLV